MTTTVINLKGRIHDYGPRLEHAPAELVYVGREERRWATKGNWDLREHTLHNPPKNSLAQLGTPEASVAAFIRYLLDRPDLLAQARALRGKTLGCWCDPNLCHAHAIAWYADGLTAAQLAERARDLEAAAGLVEKHLFNRLEA